MEKSVQLKQNNDDMKLRKIVAQHLRIDVDSFAQEDMSELLVEKARKNIGYNIFRSEVDERRDRNSIWNIISLINLCANNKSFKKEHLRELLMFDSKESNLLLIALHNCGFETKKEDFVPLLYALKNSGALSAEDISDLLTGSFRQQIYIINYISGILKRIYEDTSDIKLAQKELSKYIDFFLKTFSIEQIHYIMKNYSGQYVPAELDKTLSLLKKNAKEICKTEEQLLMIVNAINRNKKKLNFHRSEIGKDLLDYINVGE